MAASVEASAGSPAPLTGIRHFVEFGQYENRDPGPFFDTVYYLATNPDVAAAVSYGGLSPIKHFIQYGLNEGRLPKAPDLTLNLSLATDIGSIETIKTISGFVGTSKPSETYRFTLPTTSTVSVNLNGLTGDADLILAQDIGSDAQLDIPQDLIAFSAEMDLTPESINSYPLPAGTYYVRVEQFQGEVTYDLTISATPALVSPAAGSTAPGFNGFFGYGLVDASAAVARAIGVVNLPDAPVLTQAEGTNAGDLNAIAVSSAWNSGYTGSGVIVAVVDDGVTIEHPDLKSNIWLNTSERAGNGIDDDGNGFIDDVQGWDFADNDNNPSPVSIKNSHGTHVAGTIAALKNGTGTTGVAYNAQIMPVKVFPDDGKKFTEAVYYESLANGIRYAAANGARVINISLGIDSLAPNSEIVNSAIRDAVTAGACVVIAAGNTSQNTPEPPADLAISPGVIAVGAIDRNKKFGEFSSRSGSTRLNYVVAPGVDVPSTIPPRSYDSQTGTSMAAPHVAGVAALILSANPLLTAAEVVDILTGTANPSEIVI
ncbi:MAG: S8 family serine peptidase [Oscillatoriaceae bacterium SKW80]|nr:S8 family serine peptidase [Oscillatoriaceae bacterium SKYG93]MCX8119888.1 S8 family serine peptidase [Oscillatoriaceae bacterium SKW80]MDW8452005.1 S8 family serine peptidase [Oscillatoriaceae cyanobacterium SKYGB_i_bin93]HIK27553.1 S8 family serine peptidase [Oscillatoriaceae cyanobacterium M7585_C2015_266]